MKWHKKSKNATQKKKRNATQPNFDLFAPAAAAPAPAAGGSLKMAERICSKMKMVAVENSLQEYED